MVAEYDDNDDGGSSGASSDMDEYGSDDDLTEPPPPSGDHIGDYLGLQDVMDLMDRELATTKVGQSFEREPAAEVRTVGSVG